MIFGHEIPIFSLGQRGSSWADPRGLHQHFKCHEDLLEDGEKLHRIEKRVEADTFDKSLDYFLFKKKLRN